MTNLWKGERRLEKAPFPPEDFRENTYKVVNEALLLLDIGDDSADRDIVRQLIKVTVKTVAR